MSTVTPYVVCPSFYPNFMSKLCPMSYVQIFNQIVCPSYASCHMSKVSLKVVCPSYASYRTSKLRPLSYLQIFYPNRMSKITPNVVCSKLRLMSYVKSYALCHMSELSRPSPGVPHGCLSKGDQKAD